MKETPYYLTFLTVKEGEIQLRKHISLYSTLVGNLYPPIVANEIVEIQCKLEELRKEEQPRGVSVSHLLEQHYQSELTCHSS